MTPTEAEVARRAGFGNWVDRVAAAEAGIEVLEAIVATWESTNTGDLVRRIKELEATNRGFHRRVQDAESMALKRNEEIQKQLRDYEFSRNLAKEWYNKHGISWIFNTSEVQRQCVTRLLEEKRELEAEIARLKAADLGAMQASLELAQAENARLKAEHAAEAKGWEREFNKQDAQLAIVHARLDAIGVPACETMDERLDWVQAEIECKRSAVLCEREACAKLAESLAVTIRARNVPQCQHQFEQREIGQSDTFTTMRTYCAKCGLQYSDNLVARDKS